MPRTVLVGGKLLVSNDEGKISLVELDSGKVVAENSLSSGLHANPVPSDCCLLLRTDENVYCIDGSFVADRGSVTK